MHASRSPTIPVVSTPPAIRAWTRAEALSLVRNHGEKVISIFLPTHHPSELSHQDPIRLKNLLRQLDNSDKEVHAMASAVQDTVEALAVLRHPGAGLAIYADSKGVRSYWTSTSLPELLVVSSRPHILPLVPMLQDDGRFYLLELHQHGIRLHEGSKEDLKEIIVSGFSGKAEIHQHRPTDHMECTRTAHLVACLPHIHIGSVHEQGAKERALKYFRSVDSALKSILGDSTAPLLLSGVEWLQPLYAEVNHYKPLLSQGIPSDTTVLGTSALHALAWSMIAPHFVRHEQEAVEHHNQVQHLGLISHDLSQVLIRLMERRVSSLLVAPDFHPMGAVDCLALSVSEHDPVQPGDEDLANAAVVLAFKQPIPVWVVDRQVIPGGSGISACLSY